MLVLGTVDPEASFLSALTFGLIDARYVRIALVTLCAVKVEMDATRGPFAALSHGVLEVRPRSTEVCENPSRQSGLYFALRSYQKCADGIVVPRGR